MPDQFSLPSSSYNELIKVIIGYSHQGENATLDSLSQLIGMPRTRISGNSKFLSELGLIEGGKKKSSTALGTKLGRALDHSQVAESREAWQEAIRGNEKFANLVTTVRIKNRMSEDQLSSHILFVSGQKATQPNRTGARTVVDILTTSGLLEQQDGQFQVATPTTEIQEESAEPNEESAEPNEDSGKDEIVAESSTERDTPSKQTAILPTVPAIAINIQLQLPETENPAVYENLFKALRKHLLNPDE